jgi:methylenetetrahydrofolate reductase (NADPH)
VIDVPRFEILPFARGEEEAAALPASVRLTVTCSPKYGLDHCVKAAMRLRALGHRLTVHLAARMLRDRAHLDEVLAALVHSSIDEIFLIGGDALAPQGPYASALELLPTLTCHPHRPRTIGIAGYPEGHPFIDSSTLERTLVEKSRWADFITTQICFDSKAVLAWIESIRRIGVTLPVAIGLPGIVNRRKLLEISLRVGVGPSLAFLRKQGGVGHLMRMSERSATDLHHALAPRLGEARLGIAGFHYFTFNRLIETWRWARTHRAGPPLDCDAHKEVTPR